MVAPTHKIWYGGAKLAMKNGKKRKQESSKEPAGVTRQTMGGAQATKNHHTRKLKESKNTRGRHETLDYK